MKTNEDTSILITNKTFQKILTNWNEYNENAKNRVCRDYNLNFKDIEVLRQLWLGLHFKKVEQPQIAIEQALQETIWKLAERKNTITRSKSRQYYQLFAKIAAILIIPLISYTLYILFIDAKKQPEENFNQLVTVNSQAGTITNLTLPDGSKVFLNAESSITYPNYFSGNTRNVTLNGEGYFKVVKNKQIPMIVSTSHLHLKVYGTTFNIHSYPSENFQKVTLVEGSISLSSRLGMHNEQDELFITPGQTVTYFNKSKKLSIEKTDTYSHTAWKDGLLIFRNTPFESILKQLSRKYNVKIELKDLSLGSIRIDAVFKNEDINEILRLLSLSTHFKYNYAPPVKLQDGSFEQSKIYIKKSHEK